MSQKSGYMSLEHEEFEVEFIKKTPNLLAGLLGCDPGDVLVRPHQSKNYDARVEIDGMTVVFALEIKKLERIHTSTQNRLAGLAQGLSFEGLQLLVGVPEMPAHTAASFARRGLAWLDLNGQGSIPLPDHQRPDPIAEPTRKRRARLSPAAIAVGRLLVTSEDHQLSQKVICDQTGISPPTVSRAVKQLEGFGLVRRAAGRRIHLLDVSVFERFAPQEASAQLNIQEWKQGERDAYLLSQRLVSLAQEMLLLAPGSPAIERVRAQQQMLIDGMEELRVGAPGDLSDPELRGLEASVRGVVARLKAERDRWL